MIFIWTWIDRDGQFLHDRILGTRLRNAPRAPSPGVRKIAPPGRQVIPSFNQKTYAPILTGAFRN